MGTRTTLGPAFLFLWGLQCLLPHMHSLTSYTSPLRAGLGAPITPHQKPIQELKATVPNGPSPTSPPAQGPKSSTSEASHSHQK